MDEDEMLKRMTKLLEQGCTMLASHHSCGAPLFRCKGEIICPACSLEEGIPSAQEAAQMGEAEAGEAEASKAEVGEAEVGEAEVKDRDEVVLAKSLLRRTLLRRLKDLTEGVEDEGDLDKLYRLLACIEGIMNILKALER